MHESHLEAAALEAGKVLLLEKPRVIDQARAYGISLLGFK